MEGGRRRLIFEVLAVGWALSIMTSCIPSTALGGGLGSQVLTYPKMRATRRLENQPMLTRDLTVHRGFGTCPAVQSSR